MLLTLLSYAAGVAASAIVTRGGTPEWWRIAIRVQVAATAVLLSFASAWRLEIGGSLLGIAGLVGVVTVIGAAAWATRGPTSVGAAALDTWAAMPNTSFWVIPIAAALGGPAAATAAVLADRLLALPTGVLIHLMRRDAPRPQRTSTSWVDQAPLLALVAGLAARALGPAPSWTATALTAAGPVLAFSGAVLWMGAVRQLVSLHPGSSTPSIRRRFVLLASTRVVGCSIVVGLAWGSELAVVAALWAGSIPAFGPALSTVLYGYPGRVAAFAAKWGWVVAPPGVALALLAAR